MGFALSFSKMCSQGRLKNETILLPVNKNDKPDFELIENLMKYIQSKNKPLFQMIGKIK